MSENTIDEHLGRAKKVPNLYQSSYIKKALVATILVINVVLIYFNFFQPAVDMCM